jgi:hypothetical protein
VTWGLCSRLLSVLSVPAKHAHNLWRGNTYLTVNIALVEASISTFFLSFFSVSYNHKGMHFSM